MFDIGFFELAVIAVVALLVLGPERLPYAARSVGLFIGRIKRSIGNVQQEIEQELRFEEMRRAAEARARELEKQLEQDPTQTSESIEPSIAAPPTNKSEHKDEH